MLIAFEMAHFCCSTLGGNLDFTYLLQKKFYNIEHWVVGSGSNT